MRTANPTLIGGFVVGAITLIVLGLLVFGGTTWFAERNTFIAEIESNAAPTPWPQTSSKYIAR